MLDSIRAIDIVRYIIVGVRSWEGPLWEVPLYLYVYRSYLSHLKAKYIKDMKELSTSTEDDSESLPASSELHPSNSLEKSQV